MSEKTPFEQWWYDVGSGISPRAGSDLEQYAKRVALNAWCSALMHAETIILRKDEEPREAA